MSLIEGIKKLTQPYDDDDDFFDEADESFKAPSMAGEAQRKFENTFSTSAAAEPEPEEEEEEDSAVSEGASLFGSFKRAKAKAGKQPGGDQQIILFSPKSIAECGELANYINNARSVVLTLEGVPSDGAIRMLDFMTGIAFALQGKITPISSKTFFITPQNVDIVGSGSGSADPNHI